MCAPAVIAGVAVSAAGVGVQAYSQYQKGQSDAAVAETNARLADRQAGDVIARGATAARQIEIQGQQIDASARAIEGAGNAVGGSVDNERIGSDINAAVDAEVTRANAAREAWGYKAQAVDLRVQAKAARKAGFLGAVGTVLTGAGSTAGTLGGYFGKKE